MRPPLGAAGRVVSLYLPGVGAQGVAGEGGLNRAVTGHPRSFHSAQRWPYALLPIVESAYECLNFYDTSNSLSVIFALQRGVLILCVNHFQTAIIDS